MKNDADEVLFPFQKMDVYRAARDLVVLVEGGVIRYRELRDQASRAAKSTLLRLAEGLPHFGQGLRGKYFAEAQGSLHELMAALDVASAMNKLDPKVARDAAVLGYRIRGMLIRLQR